MNEVILYKVLPTASKSIQTSRFKDFNLFADSILSFDFSLFILFLSVEYENGKLFSFKKSSITFRAKK